MDRNDIKKMEAEYEAAKVALDEQKARLNAAKIEVGNAEFAAMGIFPGDKVEVTYPKTGMTHWDMVAIFDGYRPSQYGQTVEPKFWKVKQNGDASVRVVRVNYGAEFKKVEG